MKKSKLKPLERWLIDMLRRKGGSIWKNTCHQQKRKLGCFIKQELQLRRMAVMEFEKWRIISWPSYKSWLDWEKFNENLPNGKNFQKQSSLAFFSTMVKNLGKKKETSVELRSWVNYQQKRLEREGIKGRQNTKALALTKCSSERVE